MAGGCVRGEKCLFSHSEENLSQAEFLLADHMRHSSVTRQSGGTKRVTEDLSKKIFVGGLSPSLESEDLRDFFEGNYGPVLDAVVIGSQAGDHMQSRGFGFVTFKHAASVAAAVEAHYINIYGKKVEIKSAVPRSELPALESSRAESDTPGDSHTAMSANTMLDLDEAEVLEVATPGTLCQSKNENPQAAWMRFTSEHQQAGTPAQDASCSTGLPSAKVPSNVSCESHSQSVIRGTSSSGVKGRNPTWLNSFKQWLPNFLARVSMRLKEGEWYPLSSLKGDFRATCGLELDHVSLGFEKLSDFVRAFPELCRMKIVPVGRGPATHMVLLPCVSRPIPSATGRPSARITTRSLVDGTRTYADVACQGTIARLVRPAAPPSTPPSHPGATTFGHQGMQRAAPGPSAEMTSLTRQSPALLDGLITGLPPWERSPCSYAAVAGDHAGSILQSSASPGNAHGYLEGNIRNDSHIATKRSASPSVDSSQASYVTSGSTVGGGTMAAGTTNTSEISSSFSTDDLLLLEELISRLRKTGLEQAPARNHATTGFSVPATTSRALSTSSNDASQGQAQEKVNSVDNERQRSICLPISDQEPKTPKQEGDPFATPFSHPFAGFLQENFPPGFPPLSTWREQDATSNRAKDGVYAGNRSHAIESFNPSCQFLEDSPHSDDTTYGTPTQYLSASSSPAEGYSKRGGMCEMCFERQALWVAVPCGHQNMCSACRSNMRLGNQDNGQCSICNINVERWIALH